MCRLINNIKGFVQPFCCKDDIANKEVFFTLNGSELPTAGPLSPPFLLGVQAGSLTASVTEDSAPPPGGLLYPWTALLVA
jgi:hypothetical protein